MLVFGTEMHIITFVFTDAWKQGYFLPNQSASAYISSNFRTSGGRNLKLDFLEAIPQAYFQFEPAAIIFLWKNSCHNYQTVKVFLVIRSEASCLCSHNPIWVT